MPWEIFSVPAIIFFIIGFFRGRKKSDTEDFNE